MTIPRINFRDKFTTFVTASTILLQKLFDNTIGEENRDERGTYTTTGMVERLNRRFAWRDDPKTAGR